MTVEIQVISSGSTAVGVEQVASAMVDVVGGEPGPQGPQGPVGPRGDTGPAGEAADPGDLTLYFFNGLT